MGARRDNALQWKSNWEVLNNLLLSYDFHFKSSLLQNLRYYKILENNLIFIIKTT